MDSPGLCANMILRHVTGLDRLRLALDADCELQSDLCKKLRQLVARRCAGEPMAYITGHREFYEHDFIVSRATLIPRPETELLVDLALDRVGDSDKLLLDAGCGCGNIGLSLLDKRPGWKGILLDKSLEALKISRQNAENIAPGAMLILGDMCSLPCADNSLDILVSNPPYISPDEKREVMPDVLAFEPSSALFSNKGGFGHLVALALEASRTLKPGGWLLVEHGATQQDRVMEIFAECQLHELSAHRDLSGLPRCVSARKTV